MMTAALAQGCDQGSGTGGALVPLEVRAALVAGEPGAPNAAGWAVQIEEATLRVHGVYLFEEPPPLVARGLWERGAGLWIREAHAHPGHGHFNGGQVLAEVLEPMELELGEPAWAARIIGIEGEARSMTLQLSPDAAGAVARVRGVARRGEEEVRFEGGLTLREAQRSVEGISAVAPVRRGEVLMLQIDASRWLEDADFEGMERLDEESQPMAAWQLGVRRGAAFKLSPQQR
jgi:hypothetical protein